MFERSLEETGVSYRSIDFSSAKSLRNCVERGIGITICPQVAISRELEAGSLARLTTREIVNDTPVLMIRHIDKWCSPLLKLFIDLTKKNVC